MLSTIYKNHPELDIKYYNIFEKFPDIRLDMEHAEVCDRNGKVTLALWLIRNPHTLDNIAPFILKIFSDVVTDAQTFTYNNLVKKHSDSSLLIVNPDIHDNILRYYYRKDKMVRGMDIDKEGQVVKIKDYFGVAGNIHTLHTYPSGETKTTIASQQGDIIRRDDGYTYYNYREE